MKKIHQLNCNFILSYFVDKTRKECHDETITEMGTETIMEQQCTGKYFHFQNQKEEFRQCIYLLILMLQMLPNLIRRNKNLKCCFGGFCFKKNLY